MTDSRISAPRLLAGLQAGTLAGLVLLGWFVLLSYFYFQEPWALINILAASLRNNATWGHAFSSVTSTGISAHLFVCGMLGMALGWILPRPGPTRRTSYTGMMFGVVISLFLYQFFWLRFAPLLAEYMAPLAFWIAHLLFGACIAQFPKFYLQLDPPPPPPEPVALPLADPVDVVPPGDDPPSEPPAPEP